MKSVKIALRNLPNPESVPQIGARWLLRLLGRWDGCFRADCFRCGKTYAFDGCAGETASSWRIM